MKKENSQIVQGQSEDLLQKELYEAMRRRLAAYRTLNEDIDNEIERLDRLQMKAKSVGGSSFSDMPKAPHTVYDRMSDAIARIIDLEAEIRALVKKRDDERRAIEALVELLDKPVERAIIRSRYLDLEEWVDVQFLLYGSKSDFDDKYDDYRQRMFRWHRTAISNLAVLSQ